MRLEFIHAAIHCDCSNAIHTAFLADPTLADDKPLVEQYNFCVKPHLIYLRYALCICDSMVAS